MCKSRSFSSLLFVFVAFFLISCEDSLSPQEYPPLPDENPTGEEHEDPLGYWRIWGAIDAPLDWSPNSDTVQIWSSGYGGYLYQLEESITFTLVYTGPNSKHWTFKTDGDEYYGEGQVDIYPFFIPEPHWWSDPEEPVYRSTYVRGYKWVEFGGGYHLVLADEDTSVNPFYPPWPQPEYKYYKIYLGDGFDYWAWDTVYLDLTD
ncbi:hypothetical protein KAU45_07720 [bacterium]|nr:hypothetical protein [bacterium]